MKQRLVIVLLCAGALAACQGAGGSNGQATNPDAAIALGAAESMELVTTHRYVLYHMLDPSPVSTFAKLTVAQRQALDRLASRPFSTWKLHVMGQRLLIQLPESHPAGPLDLLLSDDSDEILISRPSEKLRIALPQSRLPDILDLRGSSARADFSMSIQEKATSVSYPKPLDRKIKTRTFGSVIDLRYYPAPDRPRSWPVRLNFELTVPDDPPRYPFHQPILQAALPLLQTRRGLLVLESLSFFTGAPLRWSVTTMNEGIPSGAPTTVIAWLRDQGYTRMPLGKLSAHVKNVSRGRRIPSPDRPGLQLVKARDLSSIRDTRSTGSLTVRNRTDFAAYIFADGILLGWVSGGRSLSFSGLPGGYYRVFAVSPSRVRSWGPYDTYVPGPLTLR